VPRTRGSVLREEGSKTVLREIKRVVAAVPVVEVGKRHQQGMAYMTGRCRPAAAGRIRRKPARSGNLPSAANSMDYSTPNYLMVYMEI
jgi:hypothetical protein